MRWRIPRWISSGRPMLLAWIIAGEVERRGARDAGALAFHRDVLGFSAPLLLGRTTQRVISVRRLMAPSSVLDAWHLSQLTALMGQHNTQIAHPRKSRAKKVTYQSGACEDTVIGLVTGPKKATAENAKCGWTCVWRLCRGNVSVGDGRR